MSIKSKIQALIAAANAKTGESDTTLTDAVQTLVDGYGQGGVEPEDLEWQNVTDAVKNFLTQVTYDPTDYTTSQIANYAPASAADAQAASAPVGKTLSLSAGTLNRNGYEQTVSAGNNMLYNDIPNERTPFTVSDSNGEVLNTGTLKPTFFLRQIKATTVNMRDLGGWSCDGGTVKYGKLFRGGDPNANDLDVFLNQLCILYELDLRGKAEAASSPSVLKDKIGYSVFDTYAWYNISDSALWRQMLGVVFDCVKTSRPVYFHCAAGADRTGTLACVLEALLGMSQSDIDKDYELTSFYTGTADDTAARRRNETEWSGLITAINAKNGSTFRDKVVSFVLSLGFSIDEINTYRAAMIDGNPEILVGTSYTVANALTNVSNSNAATSAEEYQTYTATLKPTPGYLINSVSVTMGGTDITSQVFSGTEAQPVAVKYSVTNNLTNCTTSNSATQVTEGSAYTATLTPASGYAIDTVNITMGGVDVSQYYSSGTINIPSVTGNIVITATAAKVGPPNMIASAIESDGTPYNNGQGYKSGYRLNSSGVETSQSNAFVTGFMPVAKNDVIHFSDTNLHAVAGASDTSLCYIGLYNSSFAKMECIQAVGIANDPSHWTFTLDANSMIETLKIAYNGSSLNLDNVAYMRISSANLSADSYIYKES